MTILKRVVLFSGFATVLIGTFLLAIAFDRHECLMVGRAMPGFHFRDLNGKEVSLNSFQGAPYTLIIFDTNCSVCHAELTSAAWTERLQRDHSRLFAVSVNSAPETEKISREWHLSIPVGSNARSFAMLAGILAVPAEVQIDAHGVVRSWQVGDLTSREQTRKDVADEACLTEHAACTVRE